jgi:hypothetical protein
MAPAFLPEPHCFNRLRKPVLASDPFNTFEFVKIASHHDQPAAARMTRDQ